MQIFSIELNTADLYLLGIAGTLALVVIGAIIHRSNFFAIKKREDKEWLINEITNPFFDAISIIENSGDYDLVFDGSIFDSQEEVISKAQGITTKRKKEKIQKAWDEYTSFYFNVALGGGTKKMVVYPIEFDPIQKESFKSHMVTIIKLIKKI